MPPNFTGRKAERAMLDGWLGADGAHPLLSLRALGGFGKSALAWHWLTHDVGPRDVAARLLWSFYEGDASFDAFLAETLRYLSGGTGGCHEALGQRRAQDSPSDPIRPVRCSCSTVSSVSCAPSADWTRLIRVTICRPHGGGAPARRQ